MNIILTLVTDIPSKCAQKACDIYDLQVTDVHWKEKFYSNIMGDIATGQKTEEEAIELIKKVSNTVKKITINKEIVTTENERFETVQYDGTEESKKAIVEALKDSFTVEEVNVTYTSLTDSKKPVTKKKLLIKFFGSMESVEVSVGEYIITKGYATIIKKDIVPRGCPIGRFDLEKLKNG